MAEKPTCNSCAHWSPYSRGLGECMEYLVRRAWAWTRWEGDEAAFIVVWPFKGAQDTEDTDTCDKHEAI